MTAYRYYSERSSKPVDQPYRAVAVSAQETGDRMTDVAVLPQRQPAQARISAPDIYFDSNPALRRALQLLSESIDHIARSLVAGREGDAIGSDIELQALRPLLRKLFMCRSIGDGFGAVVNSLISALDNNRGLPLESPQLNAIHHALLRVQQQPFLSFAHSMIMIEELENAGFSTEPPGFEHLADWLTV